MIHESRYKFALGQMPLNEDGRRPQALIVMNRQSKIEIYIPYDEAADVLVSALKLADAAIRG